MPLETANVLYPRNATTVDTAAGVDIRLLSASNTASADSPAQSVTNSSQGTTSERTFDPGNVGVTAVAVATAFQGEGWALRLADDMTPVDDTNCNAVLTAGTHVVNLSGTVAMTGTLNLGASHSLTPRASLWRYDLTGNSGVLIGSGSGTVVTATAAGNFTASVNIVLGADVEFLPGEILLLQIGGLVGAGAGLLGGATSVTWLLNTNIAGTRLNFAAGQGIAQVCSLTGSASGAASVAGSGAPVKPTAGSSAGAGAGAGVFAATKAVVGSSAAVAAGSGAFGAVKVVAGSSNGAAAAAAAASIVKGTVGLAEVGAGGETIVSRPTVLIFDD